MRKVQLLLLLLFIGCSVHPLVDPVKGKMSTVHKINSAIKKSGLETNLGIHVLSAKSGKTIYSLNSHHLFNPASNNKIYTATAALKYLTTNYQFITTAWIPKDEINASHISRLVLKGDGDPDFSLEDIDTLAQWIASKIKSIDTIIVDNSKIDSVHYGEGWMWDEGSGWYAAQIDGLSFNDNCIDLHISGNEIGEAPHVDIIPNTNYVEIINQAITVNDTLDFEELDISRHWWNASNIIEINGEFLMEEPDTVVYYRNVHDPALFTGTVLKEMLEQKGVQITGPVIHGLVESDDVVIASHAADPFHKSLSNFLKQSDNLSGELYIKLIGNLITNNPGSWNDGLHATRLFFQDEVGLDTTSFSYVDGSGVSRYNYSSPAHFTHLLQWVYKNDLYRKNFMEALPTGGWDGTLESRMTGNDTGKYIHAKTGTLSGASCLSGFIYPPNGEPLIFSILMNGYVGDAKPYRDLQDEICRILVQQ